jgi:preprotein translocase subunit SecE
MKIVDYFRDVKGEMRHVSWPSKSQTVNYTIIVMVISIGTGIFLGLLDFVFSHTLARFI